MSQSRLQSALEAVVNVAAGFLIALGVQIIAFPLLGLAASPRQNLALGAIFTAASLARSYVLRRLFAHWGSG